MRRKIAIIDDEVDIGYLLKSNIGSDKFEVVCFQDLITGLSSLKELNPQFLFLDINFPNGNGLDHIGHIKTLLPNCFIIVISAHDEIKQILAAKSAGANDFIPKPFTRDLILDRLNKYTSNPNLTI